MRFPWEEENQFLETKQAEQMKKEIEQSKAMWKKIDERHDKTHH
ncbi:MAG: hypothetical protein AAF934_00070 [Bacteroidota bacterium]